MIILNQTISKLCYSFYMVISHSVTKRYCYFCITFSLHSFKLLAKYYFFFFFEIGRNYVSIIVNFISNNTCLQCHLLWIFVSIRRLLQLLVCIGVSTPHLKNIIPSFFFAKPPLKLLNLQTI